MSLRHWPLGQPGPVGSDLKIAFATPELLSLVRRTNLAEIAEYLPRNLAQNKANVVIFLPFTKDIDAKQFNQLNRIGDLDIKLGDGPATKVTYWEGILGDLRVILVDHPQAFENKHPYGDEEGPYPDNWWRYALFSKAVLEGFALADFKPDVIHCLDWTLGLLPVYHQMHYAGRKDHPTGRAGTYMGIHNRAMQGSFEREILPKIGMPHDLFRAIEGIELAGKVNYLKAGAEFATVIGTHLPHQVLQLDRFRRGDGLDDSFHRRQKEWVGVQNGVDYRQWDPLTDPLLEQNYGPGDEDLAGKRKCKTALQEQYNLDKSPRTPIILVLERFDTDNGFDILVDAITPLLERNVQLIMMGPGQPEIIERLHMIEQTFPGRCKVIEGYNVHAAHQILAGADALLMPAHNYSTHALAAIAMRYGTPPLCFQNNGLEDTVIDVSQKPKHGNGFTFKKFTTDGVIEGIDTLRDAYKHPADWNTLVQRCLKSDFSWDACAKEYIKAYRRVTRRVRGR
ncbi:MAG: starch synthase [Glaciecola sp.]